MSGNRASGFSDPTESFRWLLGKSWRLGRLFKSEIRVYWTVCLVLALGTYEFSKWHGLGFLDALMLGAISTVGLYLVVLVHEFGHAFAGRAFRVRTPTITLSAMGGLAHMSEPPPGPKSDVAIALAGPATHALWIGVAWLLQGVVAPLRVGEYASVDLMHWLLRLNVYLALFNLLPCFPMDGGRALRGLLALRWHPNLASLWAARVGALGAIAFIAWGLHVGDFGGGLLLLIGVTNLFACLREMTAARWGDGPYRESGAAWELDPEGWKTGSWRDDDVPADRPRRTGLLTRWRMRRRARLLRRPEDAPPLPEPLLTPERDRPADDGELDRLLDRVRDVGMSGLSEVERVRLQAISRAKQRR